VNYGFEDVLLTTDRFELRPFGLEDVDEYFDYASDAEMSLYTGTPSPFTRRRAEEGVRRSHSVRNGDRVDYAVYGLLREEWKQEA